MPQKNTVPLVVMVVGFVLMNVLAFALAQRPFFGAPFLLVWFAAFTMAQGTLIGMWWAIGLAPYWQRLLGTAAAIGIWCLGSVAGESRVASNEFKAAVAGVM